MSYSLTLPNPDKTVAQIVTFIKQTFTAQHKTQALVAVSGGIDSALSLTLTTKALGAANVTAVFLPYGEQAVVDSHLIADFNNLTTAQQRIINIKPVVISFFEQLTGSKADRVRRGNIMARCRMIAVYDLAKSLDALVVGTENKSEHYLGYFTRFGDAASDVEPIADLYKTQVRQLAHHLQLPQSLLDKAPSAGLWEGQTDELEMGFKYEDADQILSQLIDEKKAQKNITGNQDIIEKVVSQVEKMAFKRQVPYTCADNGGA